MDASLAPGRGHDELLNLDTKPPGQHHIHQGSCIGVRQKGVVGTGAVCAVSLGDSMQSDREAKVLRPLLLKGQFPKLQTQPLTPLTCEVLPLAHVLPAHDFGSS